VGLLGLCTMRLIKWIMSWFRRKPTEVSVKADATLNIRFVAGIVPVTMRPNGEYVVLRGYRRYNAARHILEDECT
jgi:hypothetical protein